MNVSSAQKQQLRSLAVETKSKTEAERKELRRARTNLFRVYENYNLDESRARTAREKISKSQLGLLNIHLDNQVELRRILNAEQFGRFRKIVGRMHHGGGMFEVQHEDMILDHLPDRQTLLSIGLTPDQQRRALDALKPSPHRLKVMAKLRSDAKQLMQVYSQYDLNDAAAKKLINGIHESQGELSALNHRKQQVVRSVLTRDQFERLNAEIGKRMQMKMKERRKPSKDGLKWSPRT